MPANFKKVEKGVQKGIVTENKGKRWKAIIKERTRKVVREFTFMQFISMTKLEEQKMKDLINQLTVDICVYIHMYVDNQQSCVRELETMAKENNLKK